MRTSLSLEIVCRGSPQLAALLHCLGRVALWASTTSIGEQARLACADVGIEPGSSAFDQCVANLYYSLWQQQNTAER